MAITATATDSIGLDYRINLAQLAATIKGAKNQLAKFHKELASLSKKASITITIHDKAAKAQVAQFKNAIQATLDKSGNLVIKATTQSFGKTSGAVPRMTKDFDNLFTAMGRDEKRLGEMNKAFNTVNRSIEKQSLAMTARGKNGQRFYETANRSTMALNHLKGTLVATSTGFKNVALETQRAEAAKAKAAANKAYEGKIKAETLANKQLAVAQAKTAKAATIVSPTAELKKMGITADTTTAQFHKMNFKVAEHDKIAKLTRVQVKELQSAMANTGRATEQQAHQFDRLGKRLAHSEYQVRKQTSAMGDARRAQERWGAGFKYMMLSQMAWIASGAVIFGTLGAIIQGLKDVVAFHQGLKALEAITRATADEMVMMSDAIRDASVRTKFFAADMISAATVMGQAGLSAKEITNSIGAVALLASATGAELKDVADLMTTVMRAYNLPATEAMRISNVLAAGISESKLQIDKMRTAMNYMGVAAYQFNISLEDTVAWLGVLSDRGLKASTIGTSFRGVLAVLTQGTDKFSKVLKRLPTPLAFSDITIRRGRKLEDSLKRLSDAGFKVTDAFSGTQRRVAMTLALMVDNVKVWDDHKDSVTGTNRALEMNKIMMEGLDSQLKQIKSIFDEIAIAATRAGGAMESPVALVKAMIQVFGIGFATITTFLDLVSLKIGAFMAATASIQWRKLIVGDLKGATEEAKAIFKEYEKDEKKKYESYFKFVERVLGAGGLFGVEGVETKDTKTLKTLVALNKEQDALVEKMKKIEQQGGRGTEAWLKLRGELSIITGLIDELLKKTGMSMDAIVGPVSTLKDIMLDMIIRPTVKAENILSFFREGFKDVELLRKAAKSLEEEFFEAFKAWELSGGSLDQDSDRYKRMLDLADKYIAAEEKLTAASEKADADRQKIKDKALKDLEKSVKDREDAEADSIKTVGKLYEDYEKFQENLAKALIDAEEDGYDKKIKLWELENKARKKMYSDLLKEAEDYYKKLSIETEQTPAIQKEAERIAALILKIKELQAQSGVVEDETKPIDPSDYARGMLDGLKEFGKELANEYETWKDLTKNTAAAMSDTLSDVFFDSMMGELKSAGDYWRAFTTSVKRMIADMAAKWLMFQAVGDMGGKGGWGTFGTILGAAADYLGAGGGDIGIGNVPSDLIYTHEGGLIKKMHSGGPNLKSDETMRILKDNEYVIKDSSARSIGVAALNYANETGRLPQGQAQQTVNKNYTYIYAMDSESIDLALRKRGAGAISDISLNAGAYARGRRDPRAGRG